MELFPSSTDPNSERAQKTPAAHTGSLVILVKSSTGLLRCTFVFHTKICSQIINKKKTHKLANTMIHLALSITKAIGTRR